MQSVDFPNADGASEEMCAADTGNRERVLSAEKFRLYIIMAEPEFLAQKTGCVIERDIVQVGEKDGIVFSRNVECARSEYFRFVFPEIIGIFCLDFSVGKDFYRIFRKSEYRSKRRAFTGKGREYDVATI